VLWYALGERLHTIDIQKPLMPPPLPSQNNHSTQLNPKNKTTTTIQPGQPGPVALEIYTSLTRLQTEQDPDPFGWVHPVA
jgi:hypothetical protein